MSYPTDLTDEQWAILEPLLQRADGPGRPTELDLRTVVNALLYKNRTGCQWRMLPSDFPPHSSVRYYFDKWRHDESLIGNCYAGLSRLSIKWMDAR